MTPAKLTQSLKAEAKRLGFVIAGACPVQSPSSFASLEAWLDAGYAGEMHYLEERRAAYHHPDHVMPGVVSLLMLGMNYHCVIPRPTGPGAGRVSRYAWSGSDYHDLIHQQLKQLKRFASELAPDIEVRGVVDTAPLLEREFGQLAGLGWSAKNTMLINKQIGSWFLLAALLINVELDYDTPFHGDHCGTCTACLDACPTNAFPEPGVLDATKCISYLTIEHRSPVPVALRQGIGDWLFGCDVCQEVCPWNRKAPVSALPDFKPLPNLDPIDLRALFFYDEDQFRARFRKTPLWRAKRRGILRNAAIVLGNRPHPDNVACLSSGLNDDEPLVRGAAAWALGRHPTQDVFDLLTLRKQSEAEPVVRDEIEAALFVLSNSSRPT